MESPITVSGCIGNASATATVDVHIAQVRKKLGETVEIKTVRGVGYRLES